MDKAAEGAMFELASPWVLICLPLPLLIWFLIPRVATAIAFCFEGSFLQCNACYN